PTSALTRTRSPSPPLFASLRVAVAGVGLDTGVGRRAGVLVPLGAALVAVGVPEGVVGLDVRAGDVIGCEVTGGGDIGGGSVPGPDRKSTHLNSSHVKISYA